MSGECLEEGNRQRIKEAEKPGSPAARTRCTAAWRMRATGW